MKKQIKSPYEIVAAVLKVPVDSITINSGYGIDGSWDSINQLAIIGALETEYKISIADNDIEKYSNMKEIVKLSEAQR